MLDMNEPLPEIHHDVAAQLACQMNNEIKCKDHTKDIPESFGNKEHFEKLVGMSVACEEVTMNHWLNNDGLTCIALQLMLDFDRSLSSPLLKPDVRRVGINTQACFACRNLLQFLYVMIPVIPPTEETW